MQNSNRLYLPRVTLVAVSSVALQATLRALNLSLAQVKFGAALLLSDRCPDQEISSELSWKKIDCIKSRSEYSRFILHELHRYIETDFILCVQWDGYILDATRWTEDFLNYDYIGAPWPHYANDANVGNGGFSLRSKRLLKLCCKLPISNDLQEDVAICRHYRSELEAKHSIRFATEKVAQNFSFERMHRTGLEFGFHGVYNMMEMLPHREFALILKSIEPGTLGKIEANEILCKAASQFDFRAFWYALRHRLWISLRSLTKRG